MNIKRFSKLTGISSHTLRYYEKIGLILNVARNSKGHRDYSEKDIAWVEFLKRLKVTGMPLNMMKTFADLRYKGGTTVNDRLQILENHHRKITENIKTLLKHKDKIADKINIYKNWEIQDPSIKT
ncbi:MAG: MerR family transcriptional regulator [Desulfobacteraceae bacterium]